MLARGRLPDMIPVIEKHPRLLGIGIDEGTAIVVNGDRMEVIGRSKVAIYDHKRFDRDRDKSYFFISPGDVLDLSTRQIKDK